MQNHEGDGPNRRGCMENAGPLDQAYIHKYILSIILCNQNVMSAIVFISVKKFARNHK